VTMVFGAVLILAAVAFVALPFLGVTQASAGDSGDLRRRALEAEKIEAYAAIKDAEFDYRMGKLTDTDFQMLREKYAGQALAVLAELDSAATVEKTLRATAAGGAVAFCPHCGDGVASAARFCGGCGRPLPRADR